jgi:hypothetical protein
MRADQKSPVVKRLRQFKPTKFLATLRDGSTRELGLSTKANKWEQLLNVIEAIPWVRIEALSDDNVVLGIVDQEVDDDLEDDAGSDAGDVMALTKIMMQVQQSTMLECRRMFEGQHRVQAEMASSMMDSLRAMQEGYQLAIKMTAMAGATSGGDPETGEPDKVMQMIQMAMAMKFGTPPPTLTSPKPAPKPAPKPEAKPAPNGVIVKTT